MNRRSMLFASIAALAGSLTHKSGAARQPAGPPVIGLLVNGAAANNPAVGAVRAGLAELGYAEGRNLILEGRYAEGKLDRLPALAAELVALDADVIAAFGGPASSAAVRATKTIPIVFAIVADPVAVGFATTLERPGGNATGITSNDPDQARRQLELLRDVMPKLARVTLLSDQDIPGADASGLAPIERTYVAAAKAQGMEPQVLKLRGPAPDLDAAFKAMADEKSEALLVLEVPVTLAHRKRIAQLAAAQNLPAAFSAGSADAGGLMSYGTNVADTWRSVPGFVDRILKGAKPADMAVEVITRREFVVDLKVARQLGLTVPQAMLARADRVID